MDVIATRFPTSHKWASQLDAIFARCEGAYSDLTLSGYRKDLDVFANWCVQHDKEFLPAQSDAVARFFDDQLRTCSYATIRRRASAIRFAHVLCDIPSPLTNSEVFLSMRRAARMKGRRPKQVLGLTKGLLDQMLEACPDTLAGTRDAALLSVGYDTLCRSSELSWMRVEDLKLERHRIYIPRAKNDPFGDGRNTQISLETCDLVSQWLTKSEISCGALFQGLHTGSVSGLHLDTSSIRRIIKSSARRANLLREATKLSGHSLRVGAAQDLMKAGLSQLQVMTIGGWKSASTLARYVENATQYHLTSR